MSNEAAITSIKVRRNPLIAIAFFLAGDALGLAWYFTDQIALLILGILTCIPAVFVFMVPALEVSRNQVQIKNLFGFTGQSIPHDGMEHLNIHEGQLVIVSQSRRATLPRPTAKSLHKADWNFLVQAIQQAQQLKKR